MKKGKMRKLKRLNMKAVKTIICSFSLDEYDYEVYVMVGFFRVWVQMVRLGKPTLAGIPRFGEEIPVNVRLSSWIDELIFRVYRLSSNLLDKYGNKAG